MGLKSFLSGDNASSLIRKVFRYNFLTILFGTFVTLSGIIVDSILISRFLGEHATASYGVIISVYLLLLIFSGALSSGGQALVGQSLGIGDVEEANRLLTIVHKSILVVSVVLVIATPLLHNQILSLLGMPESAGDLHIMCRDYLLGLVIGFPGILWASCMPMFLSLDSDAMRGFTCVLVSTAVNIAGDLLNIFVFHGGMFGMALATSISNYASVLVVLPHFLNERYCLKLWMPHSGIKGLGEILMAGVPSGLTRGMVALRTIGLYRILILIGTTTSLTALTVSNSTADFYTSFMTALSMLVLMMSSAFLKEEDRTTLSHILRTTLLYCLGPILLVAVLVLLLSKPLTGIYLADVSEAFAPAVLCTTCMALRLPLYSLNMSLANYLQGIGRLTAATIFSLFESGGMVLVCAFILGKLFGVSGVWYAFLVSECIVLLFYIMYAGVVQKHFPHSIDDFLFLAEDFGVGEEDQLNQTIESAEQVLACSEDVRQFCLAKEAGPRNSNVMALSVEELGNNIIQWGFADGKQHSINLRLVSKNGRLMMRIRDDCIPFDPRKQAELYRTGTGLGNYGLRMIFGMVQEMRYVNMLGLNILFIELENQPGGKKQ